MGAKREDVRVGCGLRIAAAMLPGAALAGAGATAAERYYAGEGQVDLQLGVAGTPWDGLAGAAGLEPATLGFGDRCSTN
jgi:hypothetical protein